MLLVKKTLVDIVLEKHYCTCKFKVSDFEKLCSPHTWEYISFVAKK